MTRPARMLPDLPNALRDGGWLARRLDGRRPAVFLDYDGVLTPIVDRPEDAVMSEDMRSVVRALARRCPVCVVSGRDRAVVQRLMGVDDLVVAGSHGFDIWSPASGTLAHPAAGGFEDLIARVTRRIRDDVGSLSGVVIEPKKASVAVHFRLAAPADRGKVAAAVEALLAGHSGELKVMPGKLVSEIQPKIDWDKGQAVLYLLQALGLDDPGVLPVYIGDDITDEDAFRVVRERGAGVIVGEAGDPEMFSRSTAASLALASPAQVRQFLAMLTNGLAG
jgi:trehalose 6-phosphate phosphatase